MVSNNLENKPHFFNHSHKFLFRRHFSGLVAAISSHIILQVLYPFNQTIRLDSNATLQALPFNETMTNDIILQLAAASNVTSIANPLTLQFIPTNQTAYKMTILSHARPNEN